MPQRDAKTWAFERVSKDSCLGTSLGREGSKTGMVSQQQRCGPVFQVELPASLPACQMPNHQPQQEASVLIALLLDGTSLSSFRAGLHVENRG